MAQQKDTFEVKNPEIVERLKEVGQLLKGIMPEGWGFTLFMFDYSKGPGGSLFYLSSAQRDDMLATLEEFIGKQKKEDDGKPLKHTRRSPRPKKSS